MRYFNKETGVGGAPYVKKTSKTMCDELKEEEYMFAYVEEAAGTSKCSVSTKDGCGDQEVEYIDKWMTKSSEEKQSQLERIGGMLDAKVTPDAKAWLLKRKAILKQFLAESNPDEL